MDTSIPLTRAAIRALGWSDTAIDGRLRYGAWQTTHRGVLLPATVPLDFQTRVRAALEAVGPHAVVGRVSAARLWGLEGLPRLAEGSIEPIQLWVPAHCMAESRPGIEVRHTTIPSDQVATHESGARATTAGRTIIDLARQLSLTSAVVIADSGLRLGLTTRSELAAIVDQMRRARGVINARKTVELARERTRSCQETRLRLRIVDAGLPEPEVGYELRDDSGILLAEADLALRWLLLWLEFDGFDVHVQRETFRRDRSRHRFIERRGWFVLRAADSDVSHPAGFIADLSAAITAAPRRIAALPSTLSPEVAAAQARLRGA